MQIPVDLTQVKCAAARESDDMTRLNSLKASIASDAAEGKVDKVKLLESCRSFEEIFLRQMLGNMRKMATISNEKESLAGSHIYWDLMDSRLATQLASVDTLGIGKFVYENLVKEVEQSKDPDGLRRQGAFGSDPVS